MDLTSKTIYDRQLGFFIKINLYNRDLNDIRQHHVETSVSLGGRDFPCTIQSTPEPNVKTTFVREYPGKLRMQLSRGLLFDKKYYVITYLQNQRTMERATNIYISQPLYSFLPVTWDIDIDPDATYNIRINVCRYSDITLHRVDLHVVHEYKGASIVREIFTQLQLQLLEQKARGFVASLSLGSMRFIQYFYRNKKDDYYDPIVSGDGIMAPYIKDMNGDPKCPINGRINGLFFMGRPDRNNPNSLPPVSPFGPCRFVITADRLFDHGKNLYFSDFWCHNKDHYVSLVITVPNSQADRFCREHILQLDKYNNIYLKLGVCGQVIISDSVWVEVLYTEAIDIRHEKIAYGAYMTRTRAIGPGQSTRLGLAKRPGCRICNL